MFFCCSSVLASLLSEKTFLVQILRFGKKVLKLYDLASLDSVDQCIFDCRCSNICAYQDHCYQCRPLPDLALFVYLMQVFLAGPRLFQYGHISLQRSYAVQLLLKFVG